MSLIDYTLEGKVDKVQIAIDRLRAFAPIENGMGDEPYYVGYSGGKDSDVIRVLCDLANVKHELWHNHTGLDAPETVYYVRTIPKIHYTYPETYLLGKNGLIVKKKMPPTRLVRYCCSKLKEQGGKGRICVMGVRKAESTNRKQNQGTVTIIGKSKDSIKKAELLNANFQLTTRGGVVLNTDNGETRRMVEQCYRTRKTMVNPIIDWTDDEVWDFIDYFNLNVNPLYSEGYCRIGCVGCPMSTNMKKELNRYPKIRDNYIRTFQYMLDSLGETSTWKTGQDVYDWWVGDKKIPKADEYQILLGDDET